MKNPNVSVKRMIMEAFAGINPVKMAASEKQCTYNTRRKQALQMYIVKVRIPKAATTV